MLDIDTVSDLLRELESIMDSAQAMHDAYRATVPDDLLDDDRTDDLIGAAVDALNEAWHDLAARECTLITASRNAS